MINSDIMVSTAQLFHTSIISSGISFAIYALRNRDSHEKRHVYIFMQLHDRVTLCPSRSRPAYQ